MKNLIVATIAFLLMTNTLLLNGQIQKCYTNELLNDLQYSNPEIYNNILRIQQELTTTSAKLTDDVYVIPVVVHIIYETESQNLDDVRVFTQMNILNEDFRRMNADTINTPAAFLPFAADCKIEFCLASFDQFGNPTTGIVRKQTDTAEWLLSFSENVKNSEFGGDDAWPSASYLNIWVCNLQNGILGYANSPGAPPNVDGIVIDYKNFGMADVTSQPYHLGRTTTHEVGHWLGLQHVFTYTCEPGDLIDDTPPQSTAVYGCPEFPALDSCSTEFPGVMFMNYMDYTDDDCMNIFTVDQKNKMRSVMETYRASMLVSAAGCNDIPPLPGDVAELLIFPVPNNGLFTISVKNFLGTQNTMEIKIYNALGQMIIQAAPEPANNVAQFFDLTGLPAGCYFVNVFNGTYFLNEEFMVY